MKLYLKVLKLILIVVPVLFSFSCNSDYTIRQRGYFRIDFPKHEYRLFDNPGYPYSFEYPVYSNIIKDSTFFEDKPENPYWIILTFPVLMGVYISAIKKLAAITSTSLLMMHSSSLTSTPIRQQKLRTR